ncbi:hypothetical protein AB1L42_01285 [Thalassoglobus sp. JC818]|uniref:hypothetical protein n=1 Tax=Thalassoglobus sp. JC818 TaxID=3232136 RepID=UPI003459B02B
MSLFGSRGVQSDQLANVPEETSISAAAPKQAPQYSHVESLDAREYVNATRFADIAGKAKGGIFSRNYKALINSLKRYNVLMQTAELSSSEKIEATDAIKQQAVSFLQRKLKESGNKADKYEQDVSGINNNKFIHQQWKNAKKKALKSQFASDNRRIESRIQGTLNLIDGLNQVGDDLAREVRTAKYQKLTGVDMSMSLFVPEYESEAEHDIASGNMSSIDRVTYQGGREFAFKKSCIYNDVSLIGANSGIPDDPAESNFAGRAVASSGLCQALGMDFVPTTNYAVHGDSGGTVQQFVHGTPAIKMGHVPDLLSRSAETALEVIFNPMHGIGVGTKPGPDGKSLDLQSVLAGRSDKEKKTIVKDLMDSGQLWLTKPGMVGWAEVDFANPVMQERLANAHIFDLLSGQVDRTLDDILFEKTDQGYVPRGVDNDISFGSDFKDFSKATLDRIHSPNIPKNLPALIDVKTANKVLAMTPQKLRECLKDGHLNPEELDAAVGRLKALQSHIRDIQSGKIANGRIVSRWDENTFRQMQSHRDNYVHRFLEAFASREMLGSPKFTELVVQDLEARNGQLFAQFLPLIDQSDLSRIFKNDSENGAILVNAIQQHRPDLYEEYIVDVL